jgi:hypothetical protein
MKKLMFFALAILFVFAACDNKNKVEENGDKNKEDSSKVTETTKESTTQEKLIGEWQLDSVAAVPKSDLKKKVSMVFNADGTGFSDKKNAKFEWSAAEKEGKSLLLIKSKEELDTLAILKVEEKKLIIVENGAEVHLNKIK